MDCGDRFKNFKIEEICAVCLSKAGSIQPIMSYVDSIRECAAVQVPSKEEYHICMNCIYELDQWKLLKEKISRSFKILKYIVENCKRSGDILCFDENINNVVENILSEEMNSPKTVFIDKHQAPESSKLSNSNTVVILGQEILKPAPQSVMSPSITVLNEKPINIDEDVKSVMSPSIKVLNEKPINIDEDVKSVMSPSIKVLNEKPIDIDEDEEEGDFSKETNNPENGKVEALVLSPDGRQHSIEEVRALYVESRECKSMMTPKKMIYINTSDNSFIELTPQSKKQRLDSEAANNSFTELSTPESKKKRLDPEPTNIIDLSDDDSVTEVDITDCVTPSGTNGRSSLKSRQQRSGKISTIDLSNDKSFRCKLCHAGFSNTDDLKIHVKTHYFKKFTCDMCPQELLEFGSFLNHRKEVHRETKMVCKRCHKLHATSKDFRRHILEQNCRNGLKNGTIGLVKLTRTEDNQYICVYCDMVFSSVEMLSLHQKRHTDNKYWCRFCEKTFSTSPLRNVHERIHCDRERNRL